MQNPRHSVRFPRTFLLATALLLLASAASEAARPPVGRTYYTVLVGVAEPYDISTACFEFGPNGVCSTDGDSCGSWLRAGGSGKQFGFTFDMSLIDSGELILLQGEGRVDTLGKKSSIGGTGRISAAGPRYNYSFAGREMPKNRCQQMLADDPVGGNGGDTVIVGSGNVASQSRDVSGFTKVVLSGVGRLEIRHTGNESLTVRADDNLLEHMRSEVQGNVLTLGNDSGVNFRTDNEIVYLLTVRDLDSLTLAGVTFADVRGIDTERFTVNISGVAGVRARGRADRQRVYVTGVSVYDAENLASRIVDIDLSGVSGAIINASEQLNGSVKGISTLEYIGNPALSLTVDPSSTVRRIR